MDCQRCKLDESVEFPGFEDLDSDPGKKSIPDEDDNIDKSDIGKFAEISGCLHKQRQPEKQLGSPLEEDLKSWGHHKFPVTVPDLIFQAAAGDEVTFVFTNQVDGKLTPIESSVRKFSGQMSNGTKNQMPIRKFLVRKTSQSPGFTALTHQQERENSKAERVSMVSNESVEENSVSMKHTDMRPNSHTSSIRASCLPGRIHVDQDHKLSRSVTNPTERTRLPLKRMLPEKNSLEDDFVFY